MLVLFLDIDGVLNDHKLVVENYCGIDRTNLYVFNKLYRELGRPDIVLSSAWRYIIHGQQMTVQGFNYMMITHGFEGKIIDITCRDEEVEGRANQIRKWVDEHEAKYLALDDMRLDLDGDNFYQVNGNRGLVYSDHHPIMMKWRRLCS